MSYEYRVFMGREEEDSTFLQLSDERLRDGLVIELERPGSELDRRSVIVYSVLYAARDAELLALVEKSREEITHQLMWVTTRIKETAPQVLTA